MFQKKISFNYNFTDIHTHILYNIDDGSDSIEISVKMLEIAYAENIREIVATPHYHPAKCTDGIEAYMTQYHKLCEIVAEKYPDLKLYLGREIYYTSDVLDELEMHSELLMNNGGYMLAEYSVNVEYAYLKNSINYILQAGIQPLIAHVERYITFWESENSVDKIRELRNMGAVIQINASSVSGLEGSRARRLVNKLLKYGLVDVVATDAHSAGTRSPKMMECITFIAKKYGAEYAKKVAFDNPHAIINNQYLNYNI